VTPAAPPARIQLSCNGDIIVLAHPHAKCVPFGFCASPPQRGQASAVANLATLRANVFTSASETSAPRRLKCAPTWSRIQVNSGTGVENHHQGTLFNRRAVPSPRTRKTDFFRNSFQAVAQVAERVIAAAAPRQRTFITLRQPIEERFGQHPRLARDYL